MLGSISMVEVRWGSDVHEDGEWWSASVNRGCWHVAIVYLQLFILLYSLSVYTPTDNK